MKFNDYLNEVLQNGEIKKLFRSKESILDNVLVIETIGQNPERSYEDRDVYIKISLENTKQNSQVTHGGVGNDIQTWLTGEDAIRLGKQFIDSGSQALEKNREQAYEIIELLAAKNGVYKGDYIKLVITKNSNITPQNYGEGFCYYDLLYVGRNDLMSRHIKNVVIYWSPFKEEFDKQLHGYSCGLSVDMINWTWEEIKETFDKQMKDFNKGK